MSWRPSRRAQRRAFRWGAAALGVLIALAFGGEWLLRTDWFNEQLRARIHAEAVNALGAGVEIGRVEFDPAALRVTLYDVASPVQERLGGRPLLRAPLIRLGLGWSSFLRGPLFLRSVAIESPEVTLASDEEGLHLPVLEESAGGMLELAIDRFDVHDGSLRWNDRRWNLSLHAEDLDALTRRTMTGCYDSTVEGGRIEYQLGATSSAIDAVEAQASLCGQELALEQLRAELGGAELLAEGRIELTDVPSAQLDYGLTGPLSALSWTFPPDWTVAGEMEIDGSAVWDSSSGTLSYQGSAGAHDLAVEAAGWNASEARFSTQYRGSLGRVDLSGLELEALGGVFRGAGRIQGLFEPSRRYQLDGEFENFGILALLESAGAATSGVIWDSAASGRFEAQGRSLEDLEASAEMTLIPVAGVARPLSGAARLRFHGPSKSLQFDELRLRTADTSLDAAGSIQTGFATAADIALEATAPDDLAAILDLLGLDLDTAPFELLGRVAFDGRVAADADPAGLTIGLRGDVETGRLSLLGYEWTAAEGNLRIDSTGFEVADAVLQDNNGEARLDLRGNAPEAPGWKWGDLPLYGVLETSRLDLAKTAAVAGLTAPVEGLWSGRVEVVGQLRDPRLNAKLEVTNAVAAGEKIDSIEITAFVSRDETLLEDLVLREGPGSVTGSGRYFPAERRFDLDLQGRNWLLSQTERFRTIENPPLGEAAFDIRASGELSAGGGGFERLETAGSWRLANLSWRGADLGGWQGAISSKGDEIRLGWLGAPLGGEFEGEAVIDVPSGTMTGDGRLQRIDPAALALLSGLPSEDLSGGISGAFELSADLADIAETFRAEGAFEQVELNIASVLDSDVNYQLYNPFPMRWVFQNRRLELEHMRLQGEGSDFEVDGDIGLGAEAALDIELEGELNLAALGAIGGDISAEGRSTVQVAIEGSRNDPEVTGMLSVRGASLRSENFSNGLTGVQGEVEFAGRQIRIRELSGVSGGGRVSLSGFSEVSREGVEFRLRADVNRVRVRYPDEVSSVVDGSLVLSGTEEQGLLSGELVVLRAATNPAASLGTLIGSLKQPDDLQPTNPLLRNLQLNIQVVSAPDLNIETSVIRDIEADIDLRVVGGFARPSLLGELTVSRGQINFHGSRYRINRGEISFVNPFRIEPVVDFEFETRIRDIDIGLILSGPARRLNVSYRSDPPLSFADLVNLVAVGRSPITDPVISSQQRVQQQSLFQTGANNVFNQAVESPVSPGLQRLFGVSRLKVDPQAGGAEANPAARISTEQQITDEVTLIYTYDLSSAQQQTFRLEYAPNRRWTFVLTRDQNGLVGSDVLYKTRLP